MPLNSVQSGEFFRNALAATLSPEDIKTIPVTRKGGGGSAAPLVKRIALNRLRRLAQTASIRNVDGDVYAVGEGDEEARFSFRVTASVEASAWTNVTRSEIADLSAHGGIYLMLWNPPGDDRNRSLYAFCIPATAAVLAAIEDDGSVMLRVSRNPEQAGHFTGRLTGHAPFVVPREWVADLRLGPVETAYLQEATADADRIAREHRGQGFERSSKVRRALEQRAMDHATEFYTLAGYQVDDVHTRKPYDLVVVQDERRLRVEVKGTRETDASVLLTVGEVKAAKKYYPDTALYILHSMTIVQTPDGPIAQGGVRRVIDPWLPKEGQLKPLAYRCTIAPAGA